MLTMAPFNLFLIFALLNLTIARSHATLTKEELHWKSVFPNTLMPKFLHDILPRPGRSTIFISNVDLESEGINDPPHAAYGYDNDYDYNYHYFYDYRYQGQGSMNKSGGLHHTTPNNKGLNDLESGNRFSSMRHNLNVSTIKENLYFFQENLFPGKKMNLPRLTHKSDRTLFLPQQVAESMPMSRDKLPEILKNFSLKSESSYAHNVRVTIFHCGRAEMKGEEKYCATFLESFVDLSVSMLGKNIRLLSHRLGKGLKYPSFTIGRGMKDMRGNNVICHKMKYPYAIYLCHSIKQTIVYDVPLVSMDGTKSNAIAVCHLDTSTWGPNHISFQFLKVKPGSVPICHFVDRNTIVWVLN